MPSGDPASTPQGISAEASVAIALGANLGDPIATLKAVRPLLRSELHSWMAGAGTELVLEWSPLFRTAPVGGPPGQPAFVNGVLLVLRGEPWPDPLALLERLQGLEARFGRQRLQHWGPRSLDLDLLWCGDARCSSPQLELPHPRLRQRAFVVGPLAAVAAPLLLPGGHQTAAALLAELLSGPGAEPPPLPLPAQEGWPEEI
ncbi:2-amino-4-hydroxy-6-hydroxymethyldihydropteridine diphosphokinase [Synechococcus sp. CS-1329]|jgi:2-amino-4-hydroxy-6-hydroxymethyldihydropteridine diphosphokinase|uniref:2-amino-4-hydroxy-6- hydroxymethyldihydropteridine diphosphokinase n=1 Tax=Synechococcus sp. CS-1329 TaxID=2847975 RepID=UPI00223B454A|nr:2-amino-4-hydroxy-6-hydroxymethyldihydropteridine diphosphokinase [Synechococcus sp. CS-1329]MCT0218318.1 2-amino-4-hydroxy-6-hydroxymethyldihydropteridine diphosphokinase [Synechococcus sp. CS-1329]